MDKKLEIKIKERKLEYLFINLPVALLGALVISSVIFIVLCGIVSGMVLNIWFSLIIVTLFIRFLVFVSYKKNKSKLEKTDNYYYLYFLSIVFYAVVLGSSAFLILPDEIGYRMLLVLFIGGLASGAALSLASHVKIFYIYSSITILPYVYIFLKNGDNISNSIAIALFVYIILICFMALGAARNVDKNIVLAFENQDLVLKLEDKIKEVNTINNNLEAIVESKTKDLNELNENLEQKIILEVEKNLQIQNTLFKSEKMASMGEMIGNIAHQWRQPLSVISMASTAMQVEKEFGMLDDETFYKNSKLINTNAQYLSKTIDDFRNFIKGNRVKSIFVLEDSIKSFTTLVKGTVKNEDIDVVFDLQKNIKVDGYENELIQCFINIFNNAKDVLIERNIENKLILISTLINNDKVLIKFKDNAGGIPENILPKIFEPYFTTKHQSKGTGLGLHMSYKLIVDGMDGTIEADNVNFEYNGQNYDGAEFTISLINKLVE